MYRTFIRMHARITDILANFQRSNVCWVRRSYTALRARCAGSRVPKIQLSVRSFDAHHGYFRYKSNADMNRRRHACWGNGGFVVGYLQGFGGGVGHPAIASAYITTTSLKSLRNGQTDDANRQSESTLPRKLVQAAAYKRSPFQLAKVLQGDEKNITEAVAFYRNSYPSTFPDPEIQRVIAEALDNSR